MENNFNEDILNNEVVLDAAVKSFIEKKAPEVIERLIAERPEILMKILAKKRVKV